MHDKFSQIILTGFTRLYAIQFLECVIDDMESVMDVVVNEARANRTVLLTARESDGSIETREVDPYSTRPGAAGKGDLLVGYCHMRGGIRSWHLTNLIAAEPTGKPFDPIYPVEL